MNRLEVLQENRILMSFGEMKESWCKHCQWECFPESFHCFECNVYRLPVNFKEEGKIKMKRATIHFKNNHKEISLGCDRVSETESGFSFLKNGETVCWVSKEEVECFLVYEEDENREVLDESNN